jgi:hypothetical protein
MEVGLQIVARLQHGVNSLCRSEPHIVAHVDAKMASALNALDQKSASIVVEDLNGQAIDPALLDIQSNTLRGGHS